MLGYGAAGGTAVTHKARVVHLIVSLSLEKTHSCFCVGEHEARGFYSTLPTEHTSRQKKTLHTEIYTGLPNKLE